MDHLFIALLTGIGLSAACGFRIFIPMLVVSVASHGGSLALAPGFEWIGTYPAMGAFDVATVLEVAAYYIPWLDNLRDTETRARIKQEVLAPATEWENLGQLASPQGILLVSAEGAGDWAERLLPLPPELLGTGNGDPGNIVEGLRTTGYFLTRWLAHSLGDRPLPEARARLVDRLKREAESEK